MSAPDVGHTPGPWYVTGSSPVGSVYSSDHELIVPWSPLLGDRKMANARLIAAAPEMLDMVIRLASHLGSLNDRQHAGRAIPADMWAEAFQETQTARGLLARIRGT